MFRNPQALNETRNEAFAEIVPCLRPPAGGIPAFSAGVGTELVIQREIAGLLASGVASGATGGSSGGAASAFGSDEIRASWLESLGSLSQAKGVILGVPSDSGAGIRRGAAYGPRALREQMLKDADFRGWISNREWVDIGDIWVNPHFLHDEMLNPEQIARSQRAMFPDSPLPLQSRLPVSPLSLVKWVLERVLAAHPHLRVFVIGGDHSVAWPVSEVLAKRWPATLGIVQPDAHTDLLPERLGVRFCFGTWTFHANELLGRGGRVVQVGIRQTGKSREHWESTLGVRQFWPEEIARLGDHGTVEAIVAHLKSVGVQQVYFSNDVDGTDIEEVSATGTPASGGPSSALFVHLIERLGQEFELVAADVMELAPDLGPTPAARDQTVQIACKYAVESLRAMMLGR